LEENTQTATKNTQNQVGVVYETSLENTLKNMDKNNGVLKTHEDQERGWLWNGKPVKMLSGFRFEIDDEEFDFNDDIQKVFLNTTKGPLKEIKIEDKVIFLDPLGTVGYFNQGPIRGHPSGRDKYFIDKLLDEVYRILYPPLLLPPIENEEESFDLQGYT